ncbi:MAG: hypothetical protein U9R37_05295 [Campylobacterota bacterium]|nr:hypothetical protein [Campylobacterota bacterium]
MIREVIKPQYTNFTINIPTSYIDREVEFIMFPLDEQEIIQETKQEKTKSLRGVFNQYADSSKISSEDNAWQNHTIEKFKKYD